MTVADPVAEFRARARAWLRANARVRDPDEEPARRRLDPAAARRFQAAMHDAGFAGITWPKEYGGQGLGGGELVAWNEESRAYDLPTNLFAIGLGMCGPTILELGTEQQKTSYLRPMLRGEEVWCQLFSEPGAGSDVASLQTRAVPDGDGWVLSGQKVWTSVAQLSDFGIIIARTDPDVPKHQGITMFVVDMHAPGVTVRPLRVMTGDAQFNEVFFENVRIPGDAVVGEVNAGWTAAVVTLRHERISIGTTVRPRQNPLGFEALAELARGRGLAGDPVLRQELADLYVREQTCDLFGVRLRQQAQAGVEAGSRGSVAKLAGALLATQGARVAARVAGGGAIAYDPAGDDAEEAARLLAAINGALSAGIAGGTNEIQRNIIGERVLGLPKEPRIDTTVPFRELKVGTQRPA